MPKSAGHPITLYARNPEVWERAKAKAARQDLSLSRYIEKVLREAETKLSNGEYSALPTAS